MQKSRLIFLLLLIIAFSIWSFSAFNLNTWKSTNSHQLEKSKHSRKLRQNRKFPHSVRALVGQNENQQPMKILGFDSDQQRLCTVSLKNSANPSSSSCLIVSVPSIYEISEEGQQQKKSTNNDGDDTSLPFTIRLAKQIIDHQQEDSSASFNSDLLTKSAVFRDLRKVLNDHNLGHTLRNRDDVPASVKTWTNYHAKLVQEAKKKNNKKHNLPLRTMKKMNTENDENDQTSTTKQHNSQLLMGGSNTPNELNDLCYSAVYSSRSNGQASISHLILPKKKQKRHSSLSSRSCQSSKHQQQLSSPSSFTRSCLNEKYPLLFRLLDNNNNQIDDELASRLESLLCQNCDNNNNHDEDDYELVSISSGDDDSDNKNEFSAILVVVPHSIRSKHRHHFDEAIMKLLRENSAASEDSTIQKPIILCDAFSLTFSMKKNDDWVKFFSSSVSASSSLEKDASIQNSRLHQESNNNLAWFAVPEQFLTKTRKYFLSSVVKKDNDNDKQQLEPEDENDFFKKLLLQTLDNFTLVASDEPQKIWKFIDDDADHYSSIFVENLRNYIFSSKNDKTENNEHSFSTVLEWQKYFTEQALHGKRPRLIVTIATDYCSPMICGFIRSHHHQQKPQQKSIIVVFAPVGTSAHDHFAFDRMVDLCNHLQHQESSSHTIPQVLWHRNIVETEMGFPANKVDPFLQDFHSFQQSENENDLSQRTMITPNNIYKYRYVIDEREAQELFLEAAVALSMSSSSSTSNSGKNEIDSRRDSLKRFSRRDSVDPDFFAVSPTQFLFEPVTQTFIFHFHQQQKEGNQYHLLSFYQDSFFSRHRHPILQHQLPSSLNSIDWLSNEVYKIKSLPPDDIPPTLNTKVETAKFKVWYAWQQEHHQDANTKQHHVHEQKQKEVALEKFLKNKMKQLKKLKRIGNVDYPRLGYRTEESGSSMIDLPVKVVEGGDEDGGTEEFQKEVRKVLRAAQNDRKLFHLYKENKKACNRSLASSSSLSTKEACQQRDVFIPRIKQMMIDFENNNDKNTDGDDQMQAITCENDGDTTPQIVFFHYPWVRDNIYHTFNDNFLPFINAMRKVISEKKILNSETKLFLCPVGVEVFSKSNHINLCINDRNLFRFKFVQLYSSRSNAPLPVFNLLFENLFGKENILDLGEGKSREKMLMMNEREASREEICSFSTAKTQNKKDMSSTIVWGRPPRPFSASSRDVAPYFLPDPENDENQLSTMALTRAFIRMMLLKRERKQRQNNKNKQIDYTKWTKEGDDEDDKDDSIRIVYLERKSSHKRVFHSDLALLAMLATYPELHHHQHHHHKKVQVKTCCERLSFLDQAELISGADILIGVHGAGLLNLIHLGNDNNASHHQQRRRHKKRLFSPLVVHISSKRLNYHEQTVIERLALMTSKALEEEGKMLNSGQFIIEKDTTDEEKVLKLIYHDDGKSSEKSNEKKSGRALRYMTTRTLVASHDSAQHWSDSFDLPMEEIEELVHRIFERFLSGV